MLGYWNSACPVHSDYAGVLVTAYVRPGKTLLAIASWADRVANVHLHFDWGKLGIDPDKAMLTAPEIPELQSACQFKPSDPIPVEPARGWLLRLQ